MMTDNEKDRPMPPLIAFAGALAATAEQGVEFLGHQLACVHR